MVGLHTYLVSIVGSLRDGEVACSASDRRGSNFESCVWKWNKSGFRPPLCTYMLNWARRTSWRWWDEWDDTVLQTQDSKFEPWRSEHATFRSQRPPTILTFTRGWGRNIFVSFKPPRPGTEPRALAWKAAVLTTTLGAPCVWRTVSSHHPQEVLLAQFSLYLHKGGLKPDSFHFFYTPTFPETD